MSNRGIDWFRRPELIFADMVTRAARDERDPRHYHRATVLAVDLDGGLLQNPAGAGGMTVTDESGRRVSYPALIGVRNPRGSIKARILSDGIDRLLDDADVRVFWPMSPTDQIGSPVSPGEHVYVVFEGSGMEHGLWLSRVSGQDSANSFRGSDSYTATSTPVTAADVFDPIAPDYPRTDAHAGLAPPVNSMDFFSED